MRLTAAILLVVAVLTPNALAQGSACAEMTLTPTMIRIGAQGGTRYVDVLVASGCDMEVGGLGWARPAIERFSSTGETFSVAVTFDPNEGVEERSGYIEVAPREGGGVRSVFVEQTGVCEVQLARSSFSFPVEGGHGFIEASTYSPDCGVSFASGYDWILVDGIGGFDVLPNEGYDREGAVSVGLRGGSATQYAQIHQTGPLSSAASPTGQSNEEHGGFQVEAPGAGVLLTLAALALALLARRR